MENKKGFLLALLTLFTACFVFADGAYVVKSVKGKVQYEVAPGKMENVQVGQTLSASTFVNTGLNSTLVVTLNNEELTVKPMQKGTVEKVAVAANAGLKKGGSVVSSNVSGNADNSKAGVNTASSRASEAKEDVEWDE